MGKKKENLIKSFSSHNHENSLSFDHKWSLKYRVEKTTKYTTDLLKLKRIRNPKQYLFFLHDKWFNI